MFKWLNMFFIKLFHYLLGPSLFIIISARVNVSLCLSVIRITQKVTEEF